MRVIAFLDELDIEVDKQSQPLVGQAQMRQQLLLVHGRDGFDRLDLHDLSVAKTP